MDEFPTRARFEALMAHGADWHERLEAVEVLIFHVVDAKPRANGEITKRILEHFYGPQKDRSHPLWKPLSSTITSAGRGVHLQHMISLGKEIRCGKNPDGTPRYARMRLWSDPDADASEKALDKPEASVDTVTIPRELAARIVSALEYHEQDELALELRQHMGEN